MPSWGQISEEVQQTARDGGADQSLIMPDGSGFVPDLVRRKYLRRVSEITGLPTVLYATRWTVTGTAFSIPPDLLSIGNEDVHGFMETLHGIQGNHLNLIIHSPGGSPSAAAAIVNYIRSKFPELTVFVPHMAMSAATMIACSANRIVMGNHSSIGPVDPQFLIQSPVGLRMVAAQAILDQFEMAKAECVDQTKLAAWAPMLGQYGPDLLVACANAQKLSQELVSSWLKRWMFHGAPDCEAKAKAIADWLSNHGEFKDHGRPISREEAIAQGLVVDRLEDSQELQDAVLSTYHATSHTFSMTACAKIIENHQGRAFLKLVSP